MWPIGDRHVCHFPAFVATRPYCPQPLLTAVQGCPGAAVQGAGRQQDWACKDAGRQGLAVGVNVLWAYVSLGGRTCFYMCDGET
eukprot:365787-Chlamydomonas_euryale.AAC.2